MDTKKEKNGTSCKEKESQLDGEEWVKNHIPMLLLYMHVDTRVNYETRKNEALFSILWTNTSSIAATKTAFSFLFLKLVCYLSENI